MIQDTIKAIREKLERVDNLTPAKREEFLKLLETLQEQVEHIPDDQGENAESITRFAELSAHEAARREPDPDLLEASLKGLEKSVRGFEVSHPELVEIVNSICVMLSHIGI